MWRVDLIDVLLLLVVAGLSLAAARLARDRRRLAARLRDGQAELAGHRDALTHAALAAERARIAHELHDVVAHGISVMTLGVGAGRMIMEKDPARARETLWEAEESGRQALAELQRMLGLFGHGGVSASRTPQPRLSDLADLIAKVRAEGLRVDVVEDGQPAEVGPALELAAYRIVQEALRNTLRHAGAGSARVTLRWRPGFLDVLVRDDGRATAGGLPGHAGSAADTGPVPAAGLRAATGNGLLGMRERVSLFGGTLQAAPHADGGFEVWARLPTTGEARGSYPPWQAARPAGSAELAKPAEPAEPEEPEELAKLVESGVSRTR
ncbi:sensor histidine kinase [Planobispora longispora]|nr:histidine kinase [Planobispora longispora]